MRAAHGSGMYLAGASLRRAIRLAVVEVRLAEARVSSVVALQESLPLEARRLGSGRGVVRSSVDVSAVQPLRRRVVHHQVLGDPVYFDFGDDDADGCRHT